MSTRLSYDILCTVQTIVFSYVYLGNKSNQPRLDHEALNLKKTVFFLNLKIKDIHRFARFKLNIGSQVKNKIVLKNMWKKDIPIHYLAFSKIFWVVY